MTLKGWRTPFSAPATAIVDRERELNRLEGLFEVATRGQGSFLVVQGEPGVGKTRLLEEFASRAVEQGFTVGHGTGLAESVVLYHPWQEALRHAGLVHLLEERPPPKLVAMYLVTEMGEIAAAAERGPDVDTAVFRAWIAKETDVLRISETKKESRREDETAVVTRDAHRLIFRRIPLLNVCAVIEGRENEAFLADLAQLEDVVKGAADPSEVLRKFLASVKYEGLGPYVGDPELRRNRLFDNVTFGLSRASRTRPILLVFDDLQWADPSSLALLHYVARNTQTSRVLVFGAYRTEAGASPFHLRDALKRMTEEELVAELSLAGLARTYLPDLATTFLGQQALPEAFLDLLWMETEGNPLFVREVLRALEEDGAIVIRGASKHLLRPVESLRVPELVREVIRVRLERLPKGDRELLEAAAACGTRFTASLVATVASEEEGRTLRGLATIALVHGLLQPTAYGYAFNHSSVQEAVYGGLSDEVREMYHRKAAEWLELAGGPIEDIAEHYYQGRDSRAVPKLREAARRAMDRYANEEAAGLLGKALELATVEKRADLLELRADALEFQAKYAEAIEHFSEAVKLAREATKTAGLLARIGEIHQKQGEYDQCITACTAALGLVGGVACKEESSVLTALARATSFKGDMKGALEFGGRALSIANLIGEREHLAQCLRSLGLIHTQKGDLREATGYLTQALEVLEQIGDQRAVAQCLLDVARLHHAKGENSVAAVCWERSRAVYERIGDQAGIARSLIGVGAALASMGDYATALEHYRTSLSIWERLGAPAYSSMAACLNNIGVAHSDLGNYREALESYGRALALWENTGAMNGVSLSLANIADVYFAMGEYGRVIEHAGRSLEISERAGAQMNSALALENLGLGYLGLRDHGRALEHFRKSAELAESIGDRGRLGAAHCGLAETYLTLGDFDTALEACQRSLLLSQETGQKKTVAESRRILGTIYRERAMWSESEQNFKESIKIAELSGQRRLAAKARYEFGLMWRMQGDVARARSNLEAAAEIFGELKLTNELEKTRSLLGTFEPEGLGANAHSRMPTER